MKRKILVGMVLITICVETIGCSATSGGEQKTSQQESVTDTQSENVGSELMAEETGENVEACTVNVQWAENMDLTGLQEFSVDSSDEQVKIVFSTDEDVMNFQLLALNLDAIDEEGNYSFKTDVLYETSMLTKENPLVIGVTFTGTVPDYGISFVDTDGKTKNYSINVSGKDGSVLLLEF